MYQKLEFDSQLVRFRCNTDCKNDPENCIGERLFRAMGDMLVLGGFQVIFDEGVMIQLWGTLFPGHQRDHHYKDH